MQRASWPGSIATFGGGIELRLETLRLLEPAAYLTHFIASTLDFRAMLVPKGEYADPHSYIALYFLKNQLFRISLVFQGGCDNYEEGFALLTDAIIAAGQSRQTGSTKIVRTRLTQLDVIAPGQTQEDAVPPPINCAGSSRRNLEGRAFAGADTARRPGSRSRRRMPIPGIASSTVRTTHST